MSARDAGNRAAVLRDEVRLAFGRITGVAELIGPVIDATCDNPLQRRMLETLASALEGFANEGLTLIDLLETEGGAA